MVRASWIAAAASCLFLFAASPAARADALPPDACNSVGADCQLLGGQRGTCAPTTCSQPSYASRGGDGPMEFVDYPCNRCRPAGASDGPSTRPVLRVPDEDGVHEPGRDEPPPPAEPAPALEPEPTVAPEAAAEPDPEEEAEVAHPAATQSSDSWFGCAVGSGSSDGGSLVFALFAAAAWVRRRARRGPARRGS